MKGEPILTELTSPNLGCVVNPVPYGCLECPLANCRYGSRSPLQDARHKALEVRNREIVRDLFFMGREEVARRHGVSVRTVTRVTREQKSERGHRAWEGMSNVWRS